MEQKRSRRGNPRAWNPPAPRLSSKGAPSFCITARGLVSACSFPQQLTIRCRARLPHIHTGLKPCQSLNTQWQHTRIIIKHRHHYINSISTGQGHLRKQGTNVGAKESNDQPANSVYLHIPSPKKTNSPVSIGRERKQAKSHLCFFSGGPPSKERLFVLPLLPHVEDGKQYMPRGNR